MGRCGMVVVVLGMAVGSLGAGTEPEALLPIVTTMPATGPALFADRPTAATRPVTAPAGETPTVSEMIGMLRAGQPREVLAAVARIQGSKKLADQYTKYDLLMLKAEGMLQTRSASVARDLFQLAAKETTEPVAKAYPLAMDALIRRATGLKYAAKPRQMIGATSQPAKAVTYDLLDYSARHAALTALFLDEADAARASLTAAMGKRDLPTLAKAAKTLSELEVLERAATGENKQVRQAKNEMALRVANVVTASLNQMNTQAQQYSQAANRIVEVSYPRPDPLNPNRTVTVTEQRKAGLTPQMRANLKTAVDTCGRLGSAMQEFATALEVDPKVFGKLTEDATRIGKLASDVLTADYSGRSTVTTRVP